jgi:hypothetical protein
MAKHFKPMEKLTIQTSKHLSAFLKKRPARKFICGRKNSSSQRGWQGFVDFRERLIF